MQNLNICFDYISLVGPMLNSDNILSSANETTRKEIISNVIEICKYEEYDLYKEEYSRFSYKELFKLGENINLYFFGPEDKNGSSTWRIECTGQGCRELEDRNIDLIEFMGYFRQEYQMRGTRIDIAIDDFKGEPSFEWILDKLEKGCYLSSFKSDYERIGTKSKGYSIQFGGRTSTRTLLIYQKNFERENKGYHLNIDYWTRFEMRWLHDRANDLLDMILSSEFELNTYAKGFLFDMLDIKVRKVERGYNNSLINTSPKWLKFLDNVKKCKVVVQSKLESTLMSSKAWYKRSITKLDTLISICNDSFDDNFLSNILMEKKENIEQMFTDEKFKLKDLAKINTYRRKLGLVDFKSIDELRDHIMNVYDNSIKKLLD